MTLSTIRSIMARLLVTIAALVLALALASKSSDAQQPDLVASAKQRNVVDVQFFADSNFQQVNTPFAYYDFPAIQAGSCSACEDFPVSDSLPAPRRTFLLLIKSIIRGVAPFLPQDAPIQWGSAVVAYSPTGGEAFQVHSTLSYLLR